MGATRVSICSGDIGCARAGACADAGSWAAKNAPVRSRTQTMLSACRQTKLVFVIFPPPSRTESTWRSCSRDVQVFMRQSLHRRLPRRLKNGSSSVAFQKRTAHLFFSQNSKTIVADHQQRNNAICAVATHPRTPNLIVG